MTDGWILLICLQSFPRVTDRAVPGVLCRDQWRATGYAMSSNRLSAGDIALPGRLRNELSDWRYEQRWKSRWDDAGECTVTKQRACGDLAFVDNYGYPLLEQVHRPAEILQI